MESISRADARAQGLTRYFTGKACKSGHTTERYTSSAACVECSSQYMFDKEKKLKARAKWRQKNSTAIRNHNYKHRYGVTYDMVSHLFDGGCDICGKTKDGMCLDHCHETGTIRGVLCRDCNTSIGKLGDTEEGLMRAVHYLRKRMTCEVVSGNTA